MVNLFFGLSADIRVCDFTCGLLGLWRLVGMVLLRSEDTVVFIVLVYLKTSLRVSKLSCRYWFRYGEFRMSSLYEMMIDVS